LFHLSAPHLRRREGINGESVACGGFDLGNRAGQRGARV